MERRLQPVRSDHMRERIDHMRERTAYMYASLLQRIPPAQTSPPNPPSPWAS
jgi:hypothetical protein